jgi:hypothetical protein
MFLIPTGSALEITTDSISQTSITWNLSEFADSGISEVILDGAYLLHYKENSTKIVQSNLKPNEQHVITAVLMDGNVTVEATATTLQEPMNEENGLFTTINLYILVLLALIFVVCAIFTGVYFLAFIGTLFSFIGIVGSLGNNFITGLIFVIMFIVTLFVGFNT